MSSIAGVRAGAGSGPYSMTKHAMQAMGGVLRNELAAVRHRRGADQPRPVRAPASTTAWPTIRGDWFDEATADARGRRASWRASRNRITVGQLDPDEVVDRYVELVEADTTELVNFIPPDIMETTAGDEATMTLRRRSRPEPS